MQPNDIYRELTSIFHDIFDDESIVLRPELTAADLAEWDSFNHINLIVAVEQRFKIKFRTAELEQLHSVGELVNLIHEKLAVRAG